MVEGIAESINVTIFTSGVMSQLKSFLFASFGHLLYILRFQFVSNKSTWSGLKQTIRSTFEGKQILV